MGAFRISGAPEELGSEPFFLMKGANGRDRPYFEWRTAPDLFCKLTRAKPRTLESEMLYPPMLAMSAWRYSAQAPLR
jgi:hypothetical protein